MLMILGEFSLQGSYCCRVSLLSLVSFTLSRVKVVLAKMCVLIIQGRLGLESQPCSKDWDVSVAGNCEVDFNQQP